LDFPLNQILPFKIEKDQGESFGIKKFYVKVLQFLEQQYGIMGATVEEIKLLNTEFEPVKKCSEIGEGQKIICLLSDSIIQSLMPRVDHSLIQDLSARTEKYQDIARQAISNF
jgi:hypothetical protein